MGGIYVQSLWESVILYSYILIENCPSLSGSHIASLCFIEQSNLKLSGCTTHVFLFNVFFYVRDYGVLLLMLCLGFFFQLRYQVPFQTASRKVTKFACPILIYSLKLRSFIT